MSYIINEFIQVLACLVPIACIDVTLCHLHDFVKPLAKEYRTNIYPFYIRLWSLPTTSTRWFQLHCVCNWIIVWWSWNEWWVLVWAKNPWTHVMTTTNNLLSMNFATALHIYHVLFWPLKPIDVVHHVTSVFVCCPLMHCMNTTVMSWHLLIGTGIPGGIDYLFLTLVKYNVLDSMVEKRINSWLNAYLRAPLGVIGSFLTFAYLRQTESKIKQMASFVILVTTYWNGTYFAKRAIESYASHRTRILESL